MQRYVRCGEVPLFLIYYQDRRGQGKHSVMLCSFRKLRQLLREKRGFTEPARYGRVLYTGRTNTPNEVIRSMLKERYDFDLDDYEASTPRIV